MRDNNVKTLAEIEVPRFTMSYGEILDMEEKIASIKSENYRLKRQLRKIERRRKNVKKFFETLLLTASIAMIVWFVISYFNVIANNLSSPEDIWSWNFFKVMVNLRG